jgi:hypothetical protein
MARGVAGDMTAWRLGDGKAAVSQQVISHPFILFRYVAKNSHHKKADTYPIANPRPWQIKLPRDSTSLKEISVDSTELVVLYILIFIFGQFLFA